MMPQTVSALLLKFTKGADGLICGVRGGGQYAGHE